MKITIELTKNEKQEAISTYVRETRATEIKDDAEYIEGNFGTFNYVPEENKFELELKEAFVFASIRLAISFMNMLKSFIGTCEMFSSCWFNNSRHFINGKEVDREGNEINSEEE